MIRAANQRALVACAALAACFTAFSYRLIHLQVTMHDALSAKADRQNTHKEPIYARRGAIIDARGEPLAQNEPVRTVIADPKFIKEPALFAAKLAPLLKMPVAELQAKLESAKPARDDRPAQLRRYVILKKDVPEAVVADINTLCQESATKKAGLLETSKAIYFEQDSIRTYPNGSMLCHVLGFINEASQGLDGVERSMNQYLEGHDGYRFVERNGTGGEMVAYRGEVHEPHDGSTVRLTIDMGLQQIVENEIDAACKQFRPIKATIILMDPHTGAILAMANRPNYDLNDQKDVPDLNRKNIAIMDQVEPGSTFKIVTAAAALSERIVHPDTEIFCENGYWAPYKLHDHHPYAELTVSNILVKSSNVGVAKLGLQLGAEKFYEYARKFGFGDKTTVNLPGEIRGKVAPPYEWDKLTLTRMPMGQSVAATPLQIVTAMSAIANGGTLMMPQIVREVIDENGHPIVEYAPREIRRVVSQKATEQVRDALIQVVGPKGTAALARVAGFKVAGKTGTAQKPDEHGRMAHEKYVVSFAGYMPAEDPAFVALVLLDEAQTKPRENFGGLVAAPVFSRIAEKAARYLGLQPTEEDAPANSILAKETVVNSARDQ